MRAVGAALSFAAAAAGCRSEEQHDGRPMSYWVGQITSRDSSQRHAAAAAFAHDAARSPEAARALLAVLNTEQEADVHATVAEALGSLGSEGERAIPELIRLLADEHDIVRVRAASALGGIGTRSPSVIDPLIRSLDDPDHDVRAAAAEALGRIGPPASRAQGALMHTVRTDRIGWVRLQALRSLGSVHGVNDSTVAFITAAATADSWSEMRTSALDALAQNAPTARAALPAIRRAESDTVLEVRNAARRAVAAFDRAP